jgi:hypothetical protein
MLKTYSFTKGRDKMIEVTLLARLRAEIDASMPYHVIVPSLDQVRLHYLNMVLKDNLRFYLTGVGTFETS